MVHISCDKVSSCFACLVVPCLAGVVIGGLLFITGRVDLSERVGTMNAATDFTSIAGGCTVSASAYERYSYYYSSSSCSSQCYTGRACADRYIHTITKNSDGTQYVLSAAPEDTLLSASSTCADLSSPPTAAASAFTVGASVPCWSAVDASTLTRYENPGNPRHASYEGLSTCRTCTRYIGFACGVDADDTTSECITIVDPAEQLAYYAGFSDTKASRNLLILIGSAVGLVACLALSYAAHRYDQMEADDSSEEAAPDKK